MVLSDYAVYGETDLRMSIDEGDLGDETLEAFGDSMEGTKGRVADDDNNRLGIWYSSRYLLIFTS